MLAILESNWNILITCGIGTVFLLFFSIFKATQTALYGPLSKFPGPPLNKLTGLPLKLAFVQARQIYYIQDLHEKYGPVVRTSPNTLSFSTPSCIRTIHKMGTSFEKAPFYAQISLKGTLLCLKGNKDHAARRKYFSKAFTQNNLLEWEGTLKKGVRRAILGMKEKGREEGKEVDVLKAVTEMSLKIMVELCFGEMGEEGGEKIPKANDGPTRAAIIDGVHSEVIFTENGSKRKVLYLLRSLPLPLFITRWIFQPSVKESVQQLKQNYLTKPDDFKNTILARAIGKNEEDTGLPDGILVKEAKAFIVAGTDTTANAATYLFWVVLKHPEVKAKLQEEVDSLPEDFSISQVQALPYLQLVITETLRMYGSVSGALPRTTPRGGKQVGEHFVPENTIVTTQSYTLHYNPGIFPEPFAQPERWENPTPEMKDSYMPFGIGARVCIGQQLAQMELALSAAMLFREFHNVRIAPSMTEQDMIVEDHFAMSPKGHNFMVVL